MPKVTIDLSDPAVRAVWETAKRAQKEVKAWPAWKRGEDVNPLDEDRFARIEADAIERAKHLTPEIKYDWQVQREALTDLDTERELWHRTAMRYTGLSSHYERALKAICDISANTSIAGESMKRLACDALGREYKP